MNREAMLDAARSGKLYPAVILHGSTSEGRREIAYEMARTLLCDTEPAARPCGVCRHCRRIVERPGGADDAPFHPDFQLLERDTKTSTSVDATRELLKVAQFSPFEARGQVFVIASAESLTGEAANALLKALEEPHVTSPRHFFLLAPSRLDLLATLRSRSLSVYLGPAAAPDRAALARTAADFASAVAAWETSRAPIHLLAAASILGGGGDFDDARSSEPWAAAAGAILTSLDTEGLPRRALLALAEALLEAPSWRLRGIPADRILEGLVARHLTAG
ncbi:MAG TPA: hypothetical protein VGS22_26385 [Thermoanaerobaculia bacterium]|jgi:DNA polymerase-3 subunit delta'|nr:hypothetical protein [Thermoanaerobaculia bacterium]